MKRSDKQSAALPIPFTDLPNRVETLTGLRPTKMTLYRWRTVGARGQVLQSSLIAGRRFTTNDDLQAFLFPTAKPANRSRRRGATHAS